MSDYLSDSEEAVTEADEFMTSREAADFLKINERTLSNMRYQRRGPAYRKHGGSVRYALTDLLAWSEGTRVACDHD
ncbi:helix-turn-helix domain-containing protein [Parvularcula oceani]|uniref:helix-turn-helix domain-containing protein n=1 Tax=Parvularcula oceani TaxID=1247963 RepID=UPI00055AF534|nr:helix-turn-helix domain-containing protein [Parvularcula oceani]